MRRDLQSNMRMPLLTEENAKTIKGEERGVKTGILYLHSGVKVCAFASKGCMGGCLLTTGRGKFPVVKAGRIRKTAFLFEFRRHFIIKLCRELEKIVRSAERANMIPAARFDGTSDLGLAEEVCEKYPHVQFYDYTKDPARMRRFLMGKLPANWHLTFSRSEENYQQAFAFLRQGAGVAMVFDTVPETYRGWRVIPGDHDDLRFMDRQVFGIEENQGYIVGLAAKGRAKKDTTGFVIRALRP